MGNLAIQTEESHHQNALPLGADIESKTVSTKSKGKKKKKVKKKDYHNAKLEKEFSHVNTQLENSDSKVFKPNETELTEINISQASRPMEFTMVLKQQMEQTTN